MNLFGVYDDHVAMNRVCTSKFSTPLHQLATGVLFGLAGFAVNWFKLELFFNIDFLFGSIIVMFALLRYGMAAGTVAALVAATCTWYHWHHPWAIVIFTAEAFFAGLMLKKRRWELSSSDMLYWCSGGLLMVWIFYHLVLGLSNPTALLIGLKQGVNGVFNTLVANAIFIAVGYGDSRTRKLPSLRQLLFVSLSLFVLIPAMGYLYIDINRSLGRQLDSCRESTSRVCDVADHTVSLWLSSNRETVKALAQLVGDPERLSQTEMQNIVETMLSTNHEFKRMAIISKSSITRAFAPSRDENGVTTVGIDLSGRPYIGAVQTAPHPFTFDVIEGRIGSPGPRLVLAAPMLKGSDYRGAATGGINFSVLQHILLDIAGNPAINITLVDQKGRVVISTRNSLRPLEPFNLPKNGTLRPIANGVGHWVPNPRPDVTSVMRWHSSFYIKEMPLNIGIGWKVVVESSLKPQLDVISRQTSLSLATIAFLILATIALSHLYAGKLSSLLKQLEKATRELPERIASGAEIVWPAPMTREMAGLTDNFQLMSTAIQQHVVELELLNESLERRVGERTRELHDSEKFTINVMDSLASNIAVLDADGVIVAINEPWQTFARDNSDPAASPNHIGMQYLSVCKESIGRDDDEGAEAAFIGINSVLNGEQDQFSLEYPCHSPDVKRWFILNVSGLKGLRHGVVISHTNITERKQIELALLESESKFRSYIDNSPDGVFVVDENGHYLEVNHSAAKITGYSEDELLHMFIHDLLPPESVEFALHQFNILKETGYSSSEFQYLNKNGIKFWWSVDAVELSKNRYLGFTKNITKRKLAEQGLIEAKVAADSANIAKTQFLANMSHEIRTPMNGVIGMTDLLLDTDLDRTQRKYSELIKKSGNNLLQLINDMLDLAKIESQKMELEVRPFDLRTEVTGTIALLSLQAREKGLELGAVIDPDVPTLLKGDAGRLRQIMTNLIGNALKFTPHGAVALNIHQENADAQKVLLLFSVTDSGIGIPADKLGCIFESFTQADDSTTRKYGGTGLGLSISKQLVEMMGGKIGVESLEGKGSVFWFSVMLERQSSEESLEHATRTESWARINRELTAGKFIRILVAEDDSINQMVAEGFLLQLGYCVDIVENGREALRLLAEHDYSLVFMDCQMPEMDGLEATAVIRDPGSNMRNHSVPIIALTANALKGDRERYLAAGMDDYLAKPLCLDSLAEVLAKWLAAAPRNEAHIFDEAGLLKRHQGNHALAREIALLFTAKAPKYIAVIRESLAEGNCPAVQQQAHMLKGAAATLGANRLASLATELVDLCESNRLDEADQAMQQLSSEFEFLLTVLAERGWAAHR
jgi:PAS domain S-box-containing protein